MRISLTDDFMQTKNQSMEEHVFTASREFILVLILALIVFSILTIVFWKPIVQNIEKIFGDISKFISPVA